jgi:intein/homing endonuclease
MFDLDWQKYESRSWIIPAMVFGYLFYLSLKSWFQAQTRVLKAIEFRLIDLHNMILAERTEYFSYFDKLNKLEFLESIDKRAFDIEVKIDRLEKIEKILSSVNLNSSNAANNIISLGEEVRNINELILIQLNDEDRHPH